MADQRGVEARAEELRARMVVRLERNRELPLGWREALGAVPRHGFVPEVFWQETAHGFVPLCRDDDVDAWLGLAYADRPVVVQVDDGRPVGGFGRSASSTMLSLYDTGKVLAAAGVRPGMRVCQVGTGTGYTAALLAHRLGAVSTVEVDHQLARAARSRLGATGFDEVTVVTADGGDGDVAGAPFDRLVSTATVQRVPDAWVRQVRPGGVIVTGWGTPYRTDALLRLTVQGDGTAVGRIVGSLACQWLRGQRAPQTLTVAECELALARTGATAMDVDELCSNPHLGTAVGLRVPGCALVFIPDDDHWFIDPTSGSWARLRLRAGRATQLVTRYGPRDLWGEITAAYEWWRDCGGPSAGSWRFTVSPDGMRVDPAPAAIAV